MRADHERRRDGLDALMDRVSGQCARYDAARNAIDEAAWTPVKYPDAVRDPETGEWIYDAVVAEIDYTAFASTKDRFTARLVVRRVKDAG